jgi:hypothetical protein
MKIICTICSRLKTEDENLLPADERYIGDHIGKAKKIAEKEKTHFFILSGKYGLISSQQKISNYDYYLENEKVDPLAETVCQQIKEANITEIDFYGEEKESWKPYVAVMQKGTNLAGVIFRTHSI